MCESEARPVYTTCWFMSVCLSCCRQVANGKGSANDMAILSGDICSAYADNFCTSHITYLARLVELAIGSIPVDVAGSQI